MCMSLFKRKDRLIHFIHIPKCGGTSVRELLNENGWKEERFPVPENLECTIRVKPASDGKLYTKHAHRAIWKAWKKDPEFQFAIIRNPYERFISNLSQMFRNHPLPEINKFPPAGCAREPNPKGLMDMFGFWKESTAVPAIHSDGSTIHWGGRGDEDNHWRPQMDFIGPKTACYRLENDLEELVGHLVEKDIVPVGCQLPHMNTAKYPIQIIWEEHRYYEAHAFFKKHYHADFSIFGYDTRDSAEFLS